MRLHLISINLFILFLMVYVLHYSYILLRFNDTKGRDRKTDVVSNRAIANIQYNCKGFDDILTLDATDILWSFWNDEDVMPDIILEILLSWKFWNPSMRIIVLNSNNIDCYLHEEDSFSHIRSLPLRSDLIRLTLLAKYGGTWLDATTFLTGPLPSWDGLTFVATHTEHYCNSRQDFIESWYLRSPKNSYVIKTWKNLLLKVLSGNHYITEGISSSFIYDNDTMYAYPLIVRNVNGIEKWWSEYLVIYVAFTYLYYNDNRFRRIVLSSNFIPSERMGYFVQWSVNWNEKKLYDFLKSSHGKEPLFLNSMKSHMIKVSVLNLKPRRVNLFKLSDDSTIFRLLKFSRNQVNMYRHMFNLVISRYDEDISWSSIYQGLRIIYHKDKVYDKNDLAKLSYDRVHYIANVGTEIFSFFTYILDNYDILPQYVGFSQGGLDKSHSWTRNDYGSRMFLNMLREAKSRGGCSKPHHVNPDKPGDFSFSFNAINPRDKLYNNTGQKVKVRNFKEWMNKFNFNVQDKIYFYPSSFMVISRNLIRSRSKDFYRSFLGYVNYTMKPAEGHYLERSWYYIFNCNLYK